MLEGSEEVGSGIATEEDEVRIEEDVETDEEVLFGVVMFVEEVLAEMVEVGVIVALESEFALKFEFELKLELEFEFELEEWEEFEFDMIWWLSIERAEG